MHQEACWRDSRSFLERSRISWISTRNWSDWRSLYPDGRDRAERFWTITSRRQITLDTERIGGSLSMILEKPDRWEIVLTSTMRWPHLAVYTKNLVNNNSGQCHSGSIRNCTNHRVPPVGGNGAVPGGAHDNAKVHKWAYVQSDMIEREDSFFAVFGQPQTWRFSSFFDFVAVRSFTADGGLLQPTGGVKTTPHKSIFAVWISTRNSSTGQKVNKFGALTTREFVTQNDKPNNMWNDMEHVETHEYIDQWLVDAVDWTTAELVCFCSVSLFLVVSVSLVSASLDCFSLMMLHYIGSRPKGRQGSSSHSSHIARACIILLWALLLISLTLPFTSSPSSFLWSPCSSRQLHLPRCGGQIPCALPLRTLAPWPRTNLPQVMSPTTTSTA